MKIFRHIFTVISIFTLISCKFDEPISIRIAHVNDTHSHFDEAITSAILPDANENLVETYTYVGGYPRLKSKVDELRYQAKSSNREFLLLHGGDAFAGTIFFSLFKGNLNAEFMNLFEFDAMAIGNHEFDLGNEALAEFAKKINFPLLSANTKTNNTDPLFNNYLPYMIKKMGRGHEAQPVAIVGLTTEFTSLISSPSDGTEFKDIIDISQSIVDHIQSIGLNKIIFLTHLGLDEDRALAQMVTGIDLIIGGHSPTLLGDHRNIGLGNDFPSPVMETDPNGNPVCIMHAIENSWGLGTTDIDFNGEGIVTACRGQNIFLVGDEFLQGYPPQPVQEDDFNAITAYIESFPNIEIIEKDIEIQDILDDAKIQVNDFTSTAIGIASEPLLHVRLPGEIHATGTTLDDGSNVAPHVAKSMVFKAEQTSNQRYVAIMNAGGIRSDIENDISVGTAYSVLPFSSTLVTMSVSGALIKDIISSAVSNAFLVSGVTFPYVSNIRYSIDITITSNPSVTNILILDENNEYQPLDEHFSYNLVTTSYLANGGDAYLFTNAQDKIDTGHVDADAFIQYVESLPGGVLEKIDNGIILIDQ